MSADPAALAVAVVSPYALDVPGGVQEQARGLTEAYRALGHRAELFAPVAGEVSGAGWTVTGRAVSVAANGSRAPVCLSPASAWRAASEIAASGADVVHLHEPFAPGAGYALLLHPRRPPVVGTFHRNGSGRGYRSLRPLLAPLARRLAASVAVSESARATAAEAAGVESTVKRNGLCLPQVLPPREPGAALRILFLGRHEHRKGLDVLLAAHADVPGAVLEICGDGPERASLQRRYPDSPVRRWRGVVGDAEKARLLAECDVLCAPSLGGESFGIVLLEAMGSGALVVASDIDGYRQAAAGHAVLVAPGDPGALAAALSEVAATGPAERAERAAAARSHADSFAMERLAAEYVELFEAVAGDRGR